MKRSVSILVLLACAAAVWFASRLAPLPTDGGAPPAPQPTIVCETWQQTLAGRIGQSIKTSDELTLVLVELHDAGDISDAELQAVQDALPDLTLKNRALTDADAERIRGVP